MARCSWNKAIAVPAPYLARADDACKALPNAEAAVVGDLASIGQTRGLADEGEQARFLRRRDPQNAGVGYQEAQRVETEDGLPLDFAVNTLAPFILTALIARPKRLVYLSSGMHRSVLANIDDLSGKRPWRAAEAYAESKLTTFCWPSPSRGAGPRSLNALELGWVATRMGAPARPTILIRGGELRRGWRSATTTTPA